MMPGMIPLVKCRRHRKSTAPALAPENAPTYVAPQESESVSAKQEVRKFKCDVCGYVVESEKELPADFVCPVCGVDRSHFYKI